MALPSSNGNTSNSSSLCDFANINSLTYFSFNLALKLAYKGIIPNLKLFTITKVEIKSF
jgi:hypothetical protein